MPPIAFCFDREMSVKYHGQRYQVREMDIVRTILYLTEEKDERQRPTGLLFVHAIGAGAASMDSRVDPFLLIQPFIGMTYNPIMGERRS